MQIPNIKQKVFIVGSPRSGTTLLQSMLTAHPQITSFLESHFFPNLIPQSRLRNMLGIVSSRAKSNFQKFIKELGCDEIEIKDILPKNAIFQSQYLKSFISLLDYLTEKEGKNIWLEKTPRHLHYVKYIEKYIPESKFIHIVREGKDVVASAYHVTHKYPELWNGARSLDQCIDRWIKDIEISSHCIHKSNHLVVRYENFVNNPQGTLRYICKFLKIAFNHSMISDYCYTVNLLKSNNEPWKESVGARLINTNNQKFYALFDKEQRHYILEKTSKVDLLKFGSLNSQYLKNLCS